LFTCVAPSWHLSPLIGDKQPVAGAGRIAGDVPAPALINPFIGVGGSVDLRLFIILAPGVTAVGMSLLGIAPSYAVLAILLLAAGLSSAAFHVPGPALVARISGGQVGKGMSFWMTAGELARSVGPLVAVGAVSMLTLEGVWPLMIVGIAASVLIYTRVKDIALQRTPQAQHSLGQTWRAMRHVLLPLTGIIVARGFMAGSLTSFLPTFFKTEGQSLWFGGMALALLEFSGALGALLAGTLSDRVGRRWVWQAMVTVRSSWRVSRRHGLASPAAPGADGADHLSPRRSSWRWYRTTQASTRRRPTASMGPTCDGRSSPPLVGALADLVGLHRLCLECHPGSGWHHLSLPSRDSAGVSREV
jgi:MFS family permease